MMAMLVLAPAVSFAQTEEQDEEYEELEAFVMTGSRIARLDMEPVAPVIQLNAESLENTGFSTVGDALRSLSFNNGQALTPTDSGVSFTPGVSTINVRGIGNNQTLVLVNGRRAAPYAAPGFDGLQTVFDLNSIPAGAIDSIEILKDGASAIYGSDAVAGVVNVRLKRDYQGMNVVAQVGDYFDTGAFMRKFSATLGTADAKSSFLVSVDFMDQQAVFAGDLDFSKNADQTSRAHKADPKYVVDGLEASGMGSLDEYLAGIGFTDPISDGWFDTRSSRGFPGYVNVPGVGRRTFLDPTNNPTADGAVNAANLFNYQTASGLYPEFRRFSFYTRATRDLTDNLEAFLELSFSRVESEVYAAQTPVDIETSRGLDEGDGMIIPSYNAFNPWGVDINNGRRRLVENAARLSDVTSDTPRIVAGVTGLLPDFATGDWSWEAGMVYSKNSVNVNNIAAADSRLQQALMGLTRNGDGSLAWNPNTALEERVYYNWFGINEQAMADYIEIYNPNSASMEMYSYDANLSGTILELPGGNMGFSVGAEHRIERWDNIKTDLNATGDILGGSEGTSSLGDRDVTAFYAEFSLPVTKQLEFQLAGRYEMYSDDGFEKDIRPKIGFKYRPLDWLVIKGSYNESFKAPDLAYLFTASSTSFSSSQVFDPVTGTQIDQIQVVTAGNPDLGPETSDNYFAGIVLEPKGRLDGLVFSAEYFEMDRSNMLAQLSDFFGYAEFLQGDFEGNPTFAGKVVRDSVTNQVLFIRDDYANISESKYKGYDFSLSYTYETENLGRFFARWDATYLDSFTIDGGEQVGSYLVPEWRHTMALNWSRGDWSASFYGILIDEMVRQLSFGNVYTADDVLLLQYTVKSQFVANLSATYSGFAGTEITVGVNNILNDEAPVDPFAGVGALAGVSYTEPAFWYVRMSYDF
ncbi:MAG: TonB-dependent receptor [Puniceicoccaceae bacterium]